ncbi:MAG: hypothetical protein EHM55_03245 [Acidobacteria bacterium]|nr:MAG: hypothetical protein EHM55_03245 [Acidobacteriota bacterium]
MSKGRPYHVYGVRLASAWPLPYPSIPTPFLADISLGHGSAADFKGALNDISLPPQNGTPWLTTALPDGSRYLRWSGVFEFLIVKDGRSVLCRPLASGGVKAFHTHLGPSLSFALINLGIEPLHSTTLVIDGAAVALMGDCGYGKSSLGASFVRAGHQLLTDDLLVTAHDDGGFMAYAGAPRVKLYPAIARRIFGSGVRGLRLRPLTPKLIIPLDGTRARRTPAPLRAIYMLTPPGARRAARVVIKALSPRRAFLELVRNTFNMAVEEPSRLERQFALASQLAMSVPVKSLSYPREFGMLSAAREAILADLRSS